MAGYIGDIPSGTLSGLPMGNTQTDPGIQKVRELMQMLNQVLQPPQQPTPPPGMLEWSDNPFANWGQRLGRGAQLAFTPATKLKDAALKRKIYMDQMSAYNDQTGQYQEGQNQFAGQAALELLRGQNQMDVAKVKASTPGYERKLAPQSSVVVDSEGNIYFASARRIAGGGLGEIQYTPVSPDAPDTPVGNIRPASQGLRIKDILGGVSAIDATSGEARPVLDENGRRVQPRPRTEDIRRAAFMSSTIDALGTLESVGNKFMAKKPGTLGTLAKQGMRVGETGRNIVGLMDPELETYQSTKELIGENLSYLITGQQISEAQAQRIINQIPSAALLTTPEGRRTYKAGVAKAKAMFYRMLKANALSTPEVFSDEERANILGLQIPSTANELSPENEVTTDPTVEEAFKEYQLRKQNANPTQ